MVYCHECGEEIAEIDTFCPFCGISLQPVAVAGDDESSEESSENETPGVVRFEDSQVELTADQLNDDSTQEEEIDMSETVVVDSGSLIEKEEIQEESEYIDISALKDEAEETDSVGTSNEASQDLDVSSGQDDIEDLLSDEKDAVHEETPKAEQTEAQEMENSENDLTSSATAVQQKTEESEKLSEPASKQPAKSTEPAQKSPETSATPIVSTSTETDEFESKTSFTESADDSEADEADSAIDSKDEHLGSDEPILTTESLKEGEAEISAEDRTEATDLQTEDENIVTAEQESGESVDIPVSDPMPETSQNDMPSQIDEKPPIEAESDLPVESEQAEPIPAVIENKPEIQNEVEEIAEPEEPSSETTPNIGVSDTDGSKAPKLKPLDEGIVLNGRYEIVRKIGGGGMGAVYLANDKNLGGVLRAVKEMVQSYIEEAQQEKAINDFKRESMLLTSLDHPSIPTIYDYFFDDKEGRFYLVMKYISGGDLAARLRSAPEGKLDELNVTEWAVQITDVLDYLHSKNPPIVYRDLKPANIMIDGNSNRVMLIDFGIARWINKEEKGVTAVGTMGYAPPELFSGNVEPSSDIYSLGSTMFHLLTGADPQSNPLLIFDFQKHPRPRQINSQLSDQMERILMKAVEYNAEKRFRSAAEMRNALKEHLENLKAGNVSYGVTKSPMSVALSDQPVFCGFCGQKIVATDMFCAFCGAKQPMAQPGVHSEEYNLGKVTAKLIIEGTSELEYPAFELVKNENLVGRRDPMSNIFPEVDLSKFDPQTKISRKHARIRREGDKFVLEDLGSSNGTILKPALKEKMRIAPHQPQVLENGDKIILGDTTLQFVIG